MTNHLTEWWLNRIVLLFDYLSTGNLIKQKYKQTVYLWNCPYKVLDHLGNLETESLEKEKDELVKRSTCAAVKQRFSSKQRVSQVTNCYVFCWKQVENCVKRWCKKNVLRTHFWIRLVDVQKKIISSKKKNQLN